MPCPQVFYCKEHPAVCHKCKKPATWSFLWQEPGFYQGCTHFCEECAPPPEERAKNRYFHRPAWVRI